MKRGFTVLELLVASLLLGMLMTILTMIFNQSSIAWRTGTAGVADLDDVRAKIAAVRFKADNAYVWQKGSSVQPLCIHSVFDDSGEVLKDRDDYVNDQFDLNGVTAFNVSAVDEPRDSYGQSDTLKGRSGSGGKNYVVNVMSAGPDRQMDTYDDIWSFPDDPSEW